MRWKKRGNVGLPAQYTAGYSLRLYTYQDFWAFLHLFFDFLNSRVRTVRVHQRWFPILIYWGKIRNRLFRFVLFFPRVPLRSYLYVMREIKRKYSEVHFVCVLFGESRMLAWCLCRYTCGGRFLKLWSLRMVWELVYCMCWGRCWERFMCTFVADMEWRDERLVGRFLFKQKIDHRWGILDT